MVNSSKNERMDDLRPNFHYQTGNPDEKNENSEIVVPVFGGPIEIPVEGTDKTVTANFKDAGLGTHLILLSAPKLANYVVTVHSELVESEDIYTIGIGLTGSAEISLDTVEGSGAANSQSVWLCAGNEGVGHIAINPAEHVSLSLKYNVKTLAQLGINEDAPAGMRKSLEEGRLVDKFVTDFPALPGVVRAAKEMLSCPYEGAVARLFLQARSLDVLLEYFRFASERKTSGSFKVSAYERRMIFEARDMLISCAHNPPSLFSLAAMVGMNYKKLNKLFKAAFGHTVYAFIHDYRLELARQALYEENVTVSEVAARFGYSYAGNFVTAYTRKFGEPPGAGRRRVIG